MKHRKFSRTLSTFPALCDLSWLHSEGGCGAPRFACSSRTRTFCWHTFYVYSNWSNKGSN